MAKFIEVPTNYSDEDPLRVFIVQIACTLWKVLMKLKN